MGEKGADMSARALIITLASVLVLGIFATGVAAGNAWGRATRAAAQQSEQRERVRDLESELAALQKRLDRHAEAQRDLAENALDCRIATAYRRGGKRLELALGQPQ
jgi:type II secretory pathway pseudopilin PulG